MYRLLAALFLLAGPPAAAQTALEVDRLDRLFDRPPNVEVNLRGSLLRLAAAATADDEPELSQMIRELDAVTVRIYPLQSARAGLDGALSTLTRGLEAEGWYTMVRVRSDPDAIARAEPETDDGLEDVWVFVNDRDDAFGGLAVVAVDHGEQTATFVHIDGLIDATQIGRLSSRFGGVDVDVEGNDE